MGHLGFLTEVEPADLDSALDRLFAGDYQIEERMMLAGPGAPERDVGRLLLRAQRRCGHPGSLSCVIELEILIDERLVGTFLADGVIVSMRRSTSALRFFTW